MSKQYVLTPIGELPNDWKVLSFEELKESGTTISYGVVQPGPEDLSGVLFIRGGDIKNGKIGSKLRTISQEVSNQYKRTLLKGGELLISLVGYPGECALVPSNLAGANIARQVALARIDKNFSSDYIQQYFASSIGKKNLLGNLVGSAQQVINLEQLRKVKIPIPILSEQKKIATVLASVDEKMDVIEDKLTQTHELKKGLMQRLLTKGIGHTTFKDSPLGKIPDSWRVSRFQDETHLITCGVAATPEYVDENVGIPFLSAQNVRDGKVVLNKYKYISRELHRELTKNNKPIKGDILYSRVGAKFGEAGVIESDFEFSVYVSLTLIKVKETNNVYFVKHLLNSELVKTLAMRSVFQGAGVPNLNVKVVREYMLPFPPKEEQDKVAQILESIDEKLQVLEDKKANYQELKKGLMQQLLTGKIRVNQTNLYESTRSKRLQIIADS